MVVFDLRQTNMEHTISLFQIFNILKKRWKLILLITLVAVLISSIISFYIMKPVYQASTQILVNKKDSENQLDFTQLRSNVELINTYSVIIKSPAILGKVIENLDLKQNEEQLNQNITINIQANSQVFSLIVEDSDASRAVNIANTLSETFQKEISSIMNVNNVTILAKAELKENPKPIKPNSLLNIAIAFVIGLMAGIGIALLLDFIDNSLKDDQDVAVHLGLPILGSVQIIPQGKGKKVGPADKAYFRSPIMRDISKKLHRKKVNEVPQTKLRRGSS